MSVHGHGIQQVLKRIQILLTSPSLILCRATRHYVELYILADRDMIATVTPNVRWRCSQAPQASHRARNYASTHLCIFACQVHQAWPHRASTSASGVPKTHSKENLTGDRQSSNFKVVNDPGPRCDLVDLKDDIFPAATLCL